MGRVFAEISQDELKAKATEVMRGDESFESLFGSDFKVAVDFENYECDRTAHTPVESLVGLHTLTNGMTFWGATAGGDWEHPVFFIVYHDGKRLRLYVPKAGNPYNSDTMEAYGNDDEADLKNAKRRYPRYSWDDDDYEVDPGDFDFDWADIQIDILNHFRPAGTKRHAEKVDEAPTTGLKQLYAETRALADKYAAAGNQQAADILLALIKSSR